MSRRDSLSSSPSVKSNTSSSISSSIQSHFLESILSIQGTPPRLPVQKRKDSLSLPTTTRNFRAFVQKSGPIFWFQDGVEATIMWEDWWWSSMWMGIWAVVAFYPYLLLCAPSLTLTIILIQTHSARFPHIPAAAYQEGQKIPTPSQALHHSLNNPTSTGDGGVKPPLVPNPPNEGSIHYYENLRDIQNMMKMVTDGYDAIAPTVKYLNWSSYNRTLILLQISLLITTLMFFFGPLIPIRPILFLVGEGAFIINHPWTQPALEGLITSISKSKDGRKLKMKSKHLDSKLREWLEMDRLDDQVWENGFKDIEMWENERWYSDSLVGKSNPKAGAGTTGNDGKNWSSHNLNYGERKPWTKGSDGWSSEELEVTGYSLDISKQVATALEPGWRWVEGDDWRIDWIGNWSSVGVDDEGYVYTDASWQRPSPYAYGHPGNPAYPPSRIRKRPQSLAPSSASSSVGGTETPFYDSDETSADEELEERFPTAAADGKKMLAVTRRRRWRRRAVRVN